MLKIQSLFLSAQHPQRGLFRWLRKVKFVVGFCAVLFAHGLTAGDVDADVQNGLTGYWSFDEGAGVIANDSSGNDRPATLVNGPDWVTFGGVANALSFDGIDDYAIFASQPQNTISISAWVYPQPTTNAVSPRIIEVPGYVLFLAQSGAAGSRPMSLGFRSRRSTHEGEWRTPSYSMAYGAWHHIAVVYNSSSISNNAELYINGVKQSVSEISTPLGTPIFNGETGIIGKGWDGFIDELRIHNRALTAAEVGFLYAQGNSDSFNFSLANSTSLSVAPGTSATNTITAKLLTGSPEPVSFSTSGLPSGAKASFSRTTCSPTCSSLLTVATSASTPTGSRTITVTGAGGGVTKTTSFTLTVTSAASVAIVSPAQGTTFTPGQSVTATGSGTNLSWNIDRISDGLASFKTGTGSSITFTVPTNSTSSQLIRITLTGTGGSVTRDYNIASSLSSGGNRSSAASVAIVSPAQGTTFAPGQTVTATGSGTNLSWYVDRSSDALPSFKTGTGSSITFTVPSNSTSSQFIRITLTGTGGLVTRDYNISAVAGTPSRLTVVWKDNSNNEANFAIQRKKGSNGTYSQIALTPANSTSYVDTTVARGVTYCYRVRAVNGMVVSTYTNEACATAP